MKKFLGKIWNMIRQELRRRKQIANMLCPSCGGQLIYRDRPFVGIWLACVFCGKEY